MSLKLVQGTKGVGEGAGSEILPGGSSKQPQHSYTIRTATEADLQYLPAVERSAGALFRTIPELAYLADDEDMSVEQHKAHLDVARNIGFEGGVIVAVPETSLPSLSLSSLPPQREVDEVLGKPVAFLTASCYRCDGALGLVQSQISIEPYFLHIHELSVHTDHQRRGLAGRLLKTMWENAETFNSNECNINSRSTAKCISIITLTTFRDIAFNGPFYGRLGWREVPAVDILESIGSKALKIWEEEQERFAAKGLAERRCWMVRILDGVLE